MVSPLEETSLSDWNEQEGEMNVWKKIYHLNASQNWVL